MSVVAVKVEKDKIVIGSDTQVTSGSDKENHSSGKLVMIDDMYIGAAGQASELQLYAQFCRNHKPLSLSERDFLDHIFEFNRWVLEKKSDYKPYNIYLIIYQGEAIAFDNENFYYKKITGYYTIGSGQRYAKAALSLGHTIKEALETATKHDLYCSEPIEIHEVSIK